MSAKTGGQYLSTEWYFRVYFFSRNAATMNYPDRQKCKRLVVLGFNAILTAQVISWRSVTNMCFLAFSHQYYITQLSFQSHRLLFSHASAEMTGENTPERKLASTEYRTHNNQVTSPYIYIVREGVICPIKIALTLYYTIPTFNDLEKVGWLY